MSFSFFFFLLADKISSRLTVKSINVNFLWLFIACQGQLAPPDKEACFPPEPIFYLSVLQWVVLSVDVSWGIMFFWALFKTDKNELVPLYWPTSGNLSSHCNVVLYKCYGNSFTAQTVYQLTLFVYLFQHATDVSHGAILKSVSTVPLSRQLYFRKL